MIERVTPPPSARLERFGLTKEQWLAVYREQGGRCAICRKTFTPGRPAHMDHNHRTGHFRALLCGTCNGLIGGLNEDVAWLRAAAEHLSFPVANKVLDEPAIHIDRRTP